MQKKSLKVKPARSIYTPKYPSYADKNPLLYPETRPYPFRHRFIKWMSTGGLASMMLLSANELSAQSKVDTLYNPFPLENAGVPYQPSMFGTGLPQRIQSKDARAAIRKAFADSGIQLEEKVWLEEGSVGVFLDGYSAKEKIGFVYMDHRNMDASFKKMNPTTVEYLKKLKEAVKKNKKLKEDIKKRNAQVKKNFLFFVEHKDRHLAQLSRSREKEEVKIFMDQLTSLEPKEENETLFNTYTLQFELAGIWEGFEGRAPFMKEFFQHVDERFEDTVEKVILKRYVLGFELLGGGTSEYKTKILSELQGIKAIESNEKFIEHFLILNRFMTYNEYGRRQNTREEYNLKLKIMNAYPLTEWFEHLEELDLHYDQNFISLKEARQIDLKNKKGTQFIAPISARGPLTIIKSERLANAEDLREERLVLIKAFNDKIGMTEKVLRKKKEEIKKLSKRYSRDLLKDLQKEKRDSLVKEQQEGIAAIVAKYKAMEQVTEEDRAAHESKLKEIYKRQREQQKLHREALEIETLRRLEGEVKRYIQWARSQMGS